MGGVLARTESCREGGLALGLDALALLAAGVPARFVGRPLAPVFLEAARLAGAVDLREEGRLGERFVAMA